MSILSLKDGSPVRNQAEQIPWPQKAPAACPISAVKARLRSVGLRPTRQRMALGWLLFAKGDRHVSAEMLYEEALRARVWKKDRYEWGLLQGLILAPPRE